MGQVQLFQSSISFPGNHKFIFYSGQRLVTTIKSLVYFYSFLYLCMNFKVGVILLMVCYIQPTTTNINTTSTFFYHFQCTSTPPFLGIIINRVFICNQLSIISSILKYQCFLSVDHFPFPQCLPPFLQYFALLPLHCLCFLSPFDCLVQSPAQL